MLKVKVEEMTPEEVKKLRRFLNRTGLICYCDIEVEWDFLKTGISGEERLD